MPPLRVLSAAQVRSLLTMQQAIAVNAQAFIQAATPGVVHVPTRIILPIEHHEGSTLFKPAYITDQSLGIKVVSVRPRNDERGLATVPAIIMLFDIASGLPQCVMDGTYLTGLRTAAGSAVATDRLAKKDASNLVVFGSGLQGKLHTLAMLAVRPFKQVVFVNRSIHRAQALVEELQPHCPGVQFSVTGSADTHLIEQAVRDADVVVTATNSSTPLFNGAWLQPGCHLNAIGSYTPDAQELDLETISRAQIVIDCEGACHSGDIAIPLKQNAIGSDSIVGDLGQVLLGARHLKQGWLGKDVTLFKSVGTAVQDMATAQAIYDEAIRQNVGLVAEL